MPTGLPKYPCWGMGLDFCCFVQCSQLLLMSTADNGSQTQDIGKIKIKFILSPSFRVNWSAVEHGSSYLTSPGSTNTVGIWGLSCLYIFLG